MTRSTDIWIDEETFAAARAGLPNAPLAAAAATA